MYLHLTSKTAFFSTRTSKKLEDLDQLGLSNGSEIPLNEFKLDIIPSKPGLLEVDENQIVNIR